MKGMFNKCYYLENIPNISKWDLKNVKIFEFNFFPIVFYN